MNLYLKRSEGKGRRVKDKPSTDGNWKVMVCPAKRPGRQMSAQSLGCDTTADVKNNDINTGDHMSQDSSGAGNRHQLELA